MIIQIRGTSGSGKTTLMRHFLEASNAKPFLRAAPNARGVRKTRVNKGEYLGYPLFILGDYTVDSGGCDGIPDIASVIKLVARYGEPSHAANGKHTAIVMFEGLLLAHSWGAMGEYAHEKFGKRYINAFLDTPQELCLKRVLKRRANRGQETPADRLEKIAHNVEADYHRVELCHTRVTARGGYLVDIPHEAAIPFMENYIARWVDRQKRK